MMNLDNLEFLQLLPQFMRDDAAVKGLAAAIDEIVPGLAAAIRTLPAWDSVGDLTEAELDELAWELNIPWYDAGASIEVKREVIANSDQVYKHLGTKAAVENVIRTYFGDGSVKEWFEYDGTPGHFEVHSSNPSLSEERLAEFLSLLAKVKRASAKLDSINISLSGQMSLSAGVAVHEISREQYAIGATLA